MCKRLVVPLPERHARRRAIPDRTERALELAITAAEQREACPRAFEKPRQDGREQIDTLLGHEPCNDTKQRLAALVGEP
jgi:hypothetical protein